MTDNISEYDRQKIFGENLRRFREEAGLTQKQLAEQLGVYQQQIRKYEHADQQPRAVFAYQMSICLGVNIERLFLTEEEWQEKRKENK